MCVLPAFVSPANQRVNARNVGCRKPFYPSKAVLDSPPTHRCLMLCSYRYLFPYRGLGRSQRTRNNQALSVLTTKKQRLLVKNRVQIVLVPPHTHHEHASLLPPARFFFALRSACAMKGSISDAQDETVRSVDVGNFS